MFGFRNGKGAVVVDGRQIAETVQCVHCAYTWQVKAGSGISRGFCNSCQGVVCGEDYCMSRCTPYEARLSLTEALAANRSKEALVIQDKYLGILPL